MLLAIDTSGPVCAACIFDENRDFVLAARSEEIGRGHAELVTDQIKDCLAEADLSLKHMKRIIVVNGPGSFTGLRVGLSAARGFSLGLGIPVTPISTLDALEYVARKTAEEGVIAVVSDARRDEYYWQLNGNNPNIDKAKIVADALADQPAKICGTGSNAINALLANPLPVIHELSVVPIEDIARLGGNKESVNGSIEPLYLRPPDAKVSAGAALERVT